MRREPAKWFLAKGVLPSRVLPLKPTVGQHTEDWSSNISEDSIQPKRKKKKYALFFDWYDKKRKELGILEDLLKTMNIRNEAYYHSPKISKNDPPDCTLLDRNNRLIAVEIRELVSEEAVRNAEQSKFAWKFWYLEDVLKEIDSILKEKAGKDYHGGPYQKIIVVIHTDEYSMNYKTYAAGLEEAVFPNYSLIDEAYLLFSVNPAEECCPYIKLNIRKVNCVS